MLILGFTLLFLAYTIGIIAIVMEIICYRKGIEYFETILLTVAFLALIFSISISCILHVVNQSTIDQSSNIMNLTLVGIALMTPLNVLAERQITMSKGIKYSLYGVSAILALLLILKMVLDFEAPIYLIVHGFLAVSILYSMFKTRTSEPGIHIKHQEKIEQYITTAILTILPFFLLLESYQKSDIPMTISVFFIILGVSKIFDNYKRLSLLKPANEVELKQDNEYLLTAREQEVAHYLVKGQTYATIAEELFISMPTVKTHVSNIYRKVGVKNKMELFYKLKN